MLTVNETHKLFNDLQKELGRIVAQIHALADKESAGTRLTPDEIAERLQQCRGQIFHLLRSYDHMVDIAMGLEAPPKQPTLSHGRLKK